MKSFLRRKLTQAIAALVMAIAVLTTIVGLGLSNGIAGAAPPPLLPPPLPLTSGPLSTPTDRSVSQSL